MSSAQLTLWDRPDAPMAPPVTPHPRAHTTPTFVGAERYLYPQLSIAVSLEIATIQRYHGGPTLAMQDRARACAQIIFQPGIEDLMFSDKLSKKGRAGAIFADLAWVLAVMAFMPYGVKFGDMARFEAQAVDRPTEEWQCAGCGMVLNHEPDDQPNDPYTCGEFDCACERWYCRACWLAHDAQRDRRAA